MQTEIKTDYDAGSPGQLAVLTSFNSAADVRSCCAEGTIYPGDALVAGSASNGVLAWDPANDTADEVIGVAVRSHSNMPRMPTIGYGDTNAYPVDQYSTQGSCEDGPIFVMLKSGQSPQYGDLAAPISRNSSTNYMEWGVVTTGQTRAKFVTGVLTGNVAVIQLTNGALLGKTQAPVVNVTGVTVTPTTATLALTNTQQLTATVAPANATDQTGTWSSSSTATATVNSSGLVTAVAAGTANITFTTTDGAKTASCAVTVSGT